MERGNFLAAEWSSINILMHPDTEVRKWYENVEHLPYASWGLTPTNLTYSFNS